MGNHYVKTVVINYHWWMQQFHKDGGVQALAGQNMDILVRSHGMQHSLKLGATIWTLKPCLVQSVLIIQNNDCITLSVYRIPPKNITEGKQVTVWQDHLKHG